MQNAWNEVMKVRVGDDGVSRSGIRHGVEEHGSSCNGCTYYFFMSRFRAERAGRGFDGHTMMAFGPFASAHEARFIGTSARFLGLLAEGQEPAPALGWSARYARGAESEQTSRFKPRAPLRWPRVKLASRLGIGDGWPLLTV